jgi:hypothetical protein
MLRRVPHRTEAAGGVGHFAEINIGARDLGQRGSGWGDPGQRNAFFGRCDRRRRREWKACQPSVRTWELGVFVLVGNHT